MSGGTRVPGLTATGLFPFTDGYGLFGGGCPRADPTKYIPDYYDDYPNAFIQTDPGAASTPAVVRLPSINLRVLYGSNPPTAKFTTAKILVTSKSTDCDETWKYSGAAVIDSEGWMLTPALPFGDYDICASIQRTSGGEYRKRTITGVQNRFPRGIKPPSATSPVIDISSSSTGSDSQCF